MRRKNAKCMNHYSFEKKGEYNQCLVLELENKAMFTILLLAIQKQFCEVERGNSLEVA